MKRMLFTASAGVLVFLLLGVLIAAVPPDSQSTLTTDQLLLTEVANLQTVDAMLWGTLDGFSISTQVATLVNTPRPTNTRTPTATANLFATPTQEVLLGSFTPTATFVSATNTYTPTRTPTASSAIATNLPDMTYAVNVGSVDRNVRVCPGLSCEVVAVVRVGETVVIDLAQQYSGENYKWVQLSNGTGWISYERIDPPLRYLQW